MMRLILVALGCLFAAGCNQQPQLSDADECISYGAKPGTQEYFQCRMAKDQQRQSNDAMLAGMILSRPQPQPYVVPMPH